MLTLPSPGSQSLIACRPAPMIQMKIRCRHTFQMKFHAAYPAIDPRCLIIEDIFCLPRQKQDNTIWKYTLNKLF
jgi:hypothetical protein